MPHPSLIPRLRSPILSSSSSSSSSSFDEDLLSDSFVIVPSDDDEVDIADTESTSTVNTALLDLLSDTSSERQPGSLSGSFHGSLSEVDDLNGPDDRGLDGSFADAEATASLITDSHATLSGEPPELTPMPRPSLVNAANTGSQFRFIFPHLDLEASTSSGTYTDGQTPNGSVANLPPLPPLGAIPSVPAETVAGPSISVTGDDQPFARLTVEGRSKEKSPIRGVDEGWLKEARTWAPTHPAPPAPITMMMPSWEKGQCDQAQYDPYLPHESPTGETKESVGEENLLFPVEERQLQLKRALRAMVAVGAETSANRWGLLALASCALAILGAIGPMSYSRRDSTSMNTTTPSHSPISTSTTSLAEIFVSTMTSSDATSATQSPRSATPLIPDFQVIRDVISTFTSGSKVQDLEISAFESMASVRDKKRKSAAACADVAIAPVVALTLPNEGESSLSKIDNSPQTWIRSMANRVIRPAPPIIPSPPTDTIIPPCDPTTAPTLHAGNRYDYLLQRSRDYALSTSAAIAQLYYPMMIHLDYELKELSRLAAYIAGRNITQSAIRRLKSSRMTAMEIGRCLARASERQRMVGNERLHQLGRSANRVWERLSRAIQGREKILAKLKDGDEIGQKVEQEILRQVVQTAQDGIEKLGEKAEEVKIEGEKSLRKAKKGLDHVIQTRSMSRVIKDNGLTQKKGEVTIREKKRRFTRARRIIKERRARGVRRQRETAEGQDQAVKADTSSKSVPVSVRSRRRKLLDAIHHAAIQVALM